MSDARVIEFSPLFGSSLKTEIRVPDSFLVFSGEDELARLKSTRIIKILTPKDGDKRLAWDSSDITQIEEAHEMWNQLLLEGLVPYEIDDAGRPTGRVLAQFDANAREVLFAPAGAPRGARHSLVTGG